MKYFSLIIVILLILLGITFAVLNSDTVTFHYYMGQREMPLSLLLAICFVIGILLGFLIMIPKVWRLRFNVRKLNKQLKVAEEEIQNLRRIPIKD